MLMVAMLLLAAGTPVASAAASPAPTAVVPAEIDRHYRDYNFVNAFSTRGERTMIAAGRTPSEPRLGRIARAMRRIAARIEDIDPGMVMDQGNVPPETALRSDLVRIASWRTDKEGSEGWVTLDVSTLDRGANVILVGKFDELGRGRGRALHRANPRGRSRETGLPHDRGPPLDPDRRDVAPRCGDAALPRQLTPSGTRRSPPRPS